ncbi:MAG: Crp/Fnr family transcriptional regulator [Rhodospirillales bacterium]|nr:Crp/Fnr family transcriptional regulator [Rhodospirillales bacterium]
MTGPDGSSGAPLARRTHALAGVPLLASLSAGDLERLAHLAHERVAASGEVLFRQGDPGETMLIVLAGELRASISGAEGREQILRRLGPGDVVGEIALIDARPRSADVHAVTRARLLVLERRAVLEELARDSALALALLRLLCERLRATSAALEALLFYDSGTRLAAVLLQLSGGREGAHVDLTQSELGEIVGVARETVNKKLREWEKAGLIALSPGRVVVKMLSRLAALLPDDAARSGF